jgi:hypothetical protein
MIWISHRGNLSGSNPHMENKPDYILEAIASDFEVEVDVWKLKDEWFLGHDEGQYKIKNDFLLNGKIWWHAKNLEALEELILLNAKCFWHNIDNYTLTSNNYIWTYPGYPLTSNSICVMPEKFSLENKNFKICAGVCSDIIKEYRINND